MRRNGPTDCHPWVFSVLGRRCPRACPVHEILMIEDLHGYAGPAAGVATSLLWTSTSLLFTAAGRRLGVVVVNVSRLLMAIVLLGVTHRLLSGLWVPEAYGRQVGYLALSGVVGLTLGDQALFTAFVDIGPRLAMLIMTTSPLFAALFGRVALGESLPGAAWIGIGLTLGGVAWVVAERPPTVLGERMPHRTRGIALAFVGAACQAAGLLLSKQGMGHGWLPEGQHMAPQAATLIRMTFAGAAALPMVAVYQRRKRGRAAGGAVSGASRDGRDGWVPTAVKWGLAFTVCGAVTGPFLGVWMSLVASDRAPLGVAQTLCSLSPVFLLPASAVIHRERISVRAILGALVAVGGSSLLFVRAW